MPEHIEQMTAAPGETRDVRFPRKKVKAHKNDTIEFTWDEHGRVLHVGLKVVDIRHGEVEVEVADTYYTESRVSTNVVRLDLTEREA